MKIFIYSLFLSVMIGYGADIGYLYPAGGQRGTVCNVMAGGQQLRNIQGGFVSGTGVTLRVVKHYRTPRIKGEHKKLLQRYMQLARERENKATPDSKRMLQRLKSDKKLEGIKLPPHPLFDDIEKRNTRELEHIIRLMSPTKKKQANAQLAEIVTLEITIASNATPGLREIRLTSGTGITQPERFYIDCLPEQKELEPNEKPKRKAATLPIIFNGQIYPGDRDKMTFKAKKGQKLVMEVQARSIIPYLADAVPGWFQAVLTLYDSKGNQLAYVDDYKYSPDPVLYYEVPENGDYTVEIHDSIYRGREDFVYRIKISEAPFVTHFYPLGGQEGKKTKVKLSGWNLPKTKGSYNTEKGGAAIRQGYYGPDNKSYLYAVDNLSEAHEKEPNDLSSKATKVKLPCIINGKIAKAGDTDIFSFKTRNAGEMVAEIKARRLNSPLNSLIQIADSKGKILAWNDDFKTKNIGLQTHYADSYLKVRLPQKDRYYVRVTDTSGHGGDAFSYRLRLSHPMPDYALKITPSSLNMRAGSSKVLTVHVTRQDGFDGAIKIELDDIPDFKLSGNYIPANCDKISMTITAPNIPYDIPMELNFVGLAKIDGEEVSRQVLPAEDMMQAFLNRHLVVAKEFLVSVKGRQQILQYMGQKAQGIYIDPGKEKSIKVTTLNAKLPNSLSFELVEAPVGITLAEVKQREKQCELIFKADQKLSNPGTSGNLIIKMSSKTIPGPKAKNKKAKSFSLGVLPALKVTIN